MRPTVIKYSIVIFVLLLFASGMASVLHIDAREKEIQLFDAERFKSVQYTDEELSLFLDIAFNRKEQRIRKWESDIRVEIKNISELDSEAITEVDSVIAILRPLILPINIDRVDEGGNVYVYRGVDRAEPSRKPARPFGVNGLAKINECTPLSREIRYAHIYDAKQAHTQTLMHEFEHVLGLEHPFRIYDYYLTIARSVIPQDYTAYGTWLQFQGMPYYISPQEKTAIRLLYSSGIRSGLKKEVLLEGLGMN